MQGRKKQTRKISWKKKRPRANAGVKEVDEKDEVEGRKRPRAQSKNNDDIRNI